MMIKLLEIEKLKKVKVSGKYGTKIFLAKTTPIIEGIPKIIPTFRSTNFCLR